MVEISWRNTLNSQIRQYIWGFMEYISWAEQGGYHYVEWNGRIYQIRDDSHSKTIWKDTGIKAVDLDSQFKK